MTQVLLAALEPELAWDSRLPYKILSQRYQGSFDMLLKRASRAPSTSRAYLPGDPVQLVDWKAYARNDQLSVREERDEAAVLIDIFLDLSQTLDWPSQDDGFEAAITKRQQALRVVFHLCYHHVNSGDLVRLVCCDFNDEKSPKSQLRLRSIKQVLDSFSWLKSESFSSNSLTKLVDESFSEGRKTGMSYFISDFLATSWQSFIKNEISLHKRMIQVLSSFELSLNWLDASVCYFDESLHKKEFLGSKLEESKDYNDTLTRWMKSIDAFSKRYTQDYFMVSEKSTLPFYLQSLTAGLSKEVST